MSTILPAWPNFVFAILEPLSLIGGWLAPFYDLQKFVAGQVPASPTPPIAPSVSVLALQLGNVYLLLMMLGVAVCYTSSEPKVVRNYLIALAIADLGHIYSTYVGLGWDNFIDVQNWNNLAWGNIGASAFLFVNRILYLLGAFGSAKAPKGKTA